jgi:hypothetical protein
MMEAVRTSETWVDNYFTRQYNPEDNSEQLYPLDPTEHVLPEHGDRFQSPNRRVFTELGLWIISKKFVVLTTHQRHKLCTVNGIKVFR